MTELQRHIRTAPGDVAPYVLLPGDPHRVEREAALWDEARLVADNREHITWTGTYKGMPVTCTSTGMGCPSTAIAIEELARCGARTLLRMGTCGGIAAEVRPGDLVIFDSACRFEGTTRCYAPIEYPAVAHRDIVNAAVEQAEAAGLRYHVGTSRCTDGLYTNRPERDVSFGGYRLSSWDSFMRDLDAMHVLAGDMESAAVMVLSRLFGLRGGCLCVCAAHLIDGSTEAPVDIIDLLDRAALETLYRVYLHDVERDAAGR